MTMGIPTITGMIILTHTITGITTTTTIITIMAVTCISAPAPRASMSRA
jgi:hypothetical protein